MLHAHPRIAIPPQTKYLRKIYKRRLLFGNLAKEANRRKLADWFSNHFDGSTKLIDLGLNGEDVADGILGSHSLGAAAAVPWQLYSAQNQKPRWGDKRPYYIHHMEILRLLYPDAQIIHVIRDGRDVVASLKEMPWWRKSVEQSILNWNGAIANGMAARHSTKLDEYIEVRYEDLLAGPAGELQRLCQFLGEAYDPSMLRFQDVARTAVPDYKMQWHSATREPLSDRSVGRWQRDLSPEEISLIEWAAGDNLSLLGYALSGAPIPATKLQSNFKRTRKRYATANRWGAVADTMISFLYTGQLDYRRNS